MHDAEEELVPSNSLSATVVDSDNASLSQYMSADGEVGQPVLQPSLPLNLDTHDR